MKKYFAAHVGHDIVPPPFCWIEQYKSIHILCGYTKLASKILAQHNVLPFYYSTQKLPKDTWIKDYNCDNQLYRSPKELAAYLLTHFFTQGTITNPFAVMQQIATMGTEILYWYKRYEFGPAGQTTICLQQTTRYRQYLLDVKRGLNANVPMVDRPSRFQYDRRLRGTALRPPSQLPYRGTPCQKPLR